MLKNLIRLDFYTMKPLVNIMLIFLIIPIILAFVTSPGNSIIITLTFVVFMLNTVFSISEKSNFNSLYGALAIQRSQGILSRYLFSLLVLAFASIISFLIYTATSFLMDGYVSWIQGFEFMCIANLISMFFISIQYPFYFKFDYTKAASMAIIPYILCFAIGVPLMNYLMKNASFYAAITDIVLYFKANFFILFLCTTLMSITLLSASYLLSLKIQKKEF